MGLSSHYPSATFRKQEKNWRDAPASNASRRRKIPGVFGREKAVKQKGLVTIAGKAVVCALIVIHK